MVNFEQKMNEVNQMADNLGLSASEANRAMKRAIHRTLVSVQNSVVKDVSKNAQIKRAFIKNRSKVYKQSRAKPGALYMMIFAIPAAVVDTPIQTKTGVRVGKHFYKDAFYVPKVRRRFKTRAAIFKRLYDKKYPLREMRIPIAREVDAEYAHMLTQVEDKLLKNYMFQLKAFAKIFNKRS